MRQLGQQAERRRNSVRPARSRQHPFGCEFDQHVVHVDGDLRAIGGVERGKLIDDLADGAGAVAALQDLVRRTFGLDHPFRSEQHPCAASRVEVQANARGEARAFRQRLRHRTGTKAPGGISPGDTYE